MSTTLFPEKLLSQSFFYCDSGGICDFLISRSPEQLEIEFPLPSLGF